MPIHRAVSAHAGQSTEQGIARDLSGNEAGIELENNLVFRDHAEVFDVTLPRFNTRSRSGPKPKLRKQPFTFSAIQIENRDRFTGRFADLARHESSPPGDCVKEHPIRACRQKSRAALRSAANCPSAHRAVDKASE